MTKAITLVLDEAELEELESILVCDDAEAALDLLRGHLRARVPHLLEGG